MVQRPAEIAVLKRLLRQFPVVGIVGARQVGKTTLARLLGKSIGGPVVRFDLEDPADLSRLTDPMLVLRPLKGLVIIDEIQRMPALFPTLRVLADRPRTPARFLLLGSASPDLVRRSSESLAGRIAYHNLEGFSLDEVGIQNADRLWFRGGFPDSYLARTGALSNEWRRRFLQTFLERDIPQLGIGVYSGTLRRFWSMFAHYHGQTWNSSEFARSFGVADTTIRNYLDLLTATMVVRQLLPWHENIGKRQVKAPKVYVADSGLLHTLLNLETRVDVERHPKVGASWEGFVIGQVVRRVGARPEECYFWSTYTGAELDLLIIRGQQRIGFEVKRTVSPSITPSMRNALRDLKLRRLYVMHAGTESYDMHAKIKAISLLRLLTDLKPL